DTGNTRCAKGSLDLFLIAKHLELARCAKEIAPLIQHAVLSQRIAKDIEVLRFKRPGIFFDLVEIWIDAPLAHLMDNDGNVVLLDALVVIASKPATRAPGLRSDVILVFRKLGPTGSARIKPARVGLSPVTHPVSEPFFLMVAAGFIPVRHQNERRMVTV